MLAKGIAGASLVLVSSLAFGAQFEYRIDSLAPNTTDTDCYEKIEDIGRRFGESAGVTINSTACYADDLDDNMLDGVITYSGENRVKISKLLDYANYGIEETALYSSAELCQESLPAQVELFKEQTGLMPHYSYCYKKSSMVENRWYLQILAVGESTTKHYVMGVDLYGQPSRGYEAYWDEIRTNLVAKGLVLSKAAFMSRTFYYRLTVGYYATSRSQIYHNGEVRLESPEACEEARARAEVGFADLSNAPIAIFCDKDGNGLWGSRINIYTLEDNVAESAEYEHRLLPGFYDTVDNCKAGRPDQIARLEARGVKVLEAFCGIDPRRRIVLHGFIKR